MAPLQIGNLGKSFVIFFILSSFAWFAASFIVFRDVLICWPVFIGNLLIGGVAGWWWYRTRYHAIFSYDGEAFELRKGRRSGGRRKWGEFSRVSLVHEGYARFSVRLYEDNAEYAEIPVSDLRLNASEFRFEAMDLVRGGSQVEESGAPAVQ